MAEAIGTTVVVGAGALGSMYAERIQNAGLDVMFFAEGERRERLRRDGVTVNGTSLSIPVRSRNEMTGAPDRVIVALKEQHLSRFAPLLPEICGPHTTVLSVMNGIDSESVLAAALGENVEDDTGRVLYCMVAGMDAVRSGDSIVYTRIGTVYFGRKRNDPARLDSRTARMKKFFDHAGIPSVVAPDMEKAVWNKFMLNVGINQWSAVLGAPYGVFHNNQAAQRLMRSAMAEVLEVAQRRGIDLTDSDMENWFSVVRTLSPEGKTSMLQDIEAGRKTEVEMFAGRVVALGRELGVSVPINGALQDLIHVREEMARSGDT